MLIEDAFVRQTEYLNSKEREHMTPDFLCIIYTGSYTERGLYFTQEMGKCSTEHCKTS